VVNPSPPPDFEASFRKAQALRTDYDWSEASKVYETLAEGAAVRGELDRAAFVRGEAGLCHFRAAFQVGNDKDFARLIEMARSAYQSAIELHARAATPTSAAHTALLKGDASFASSYLSTSAEEKRRLLSESSVFRRQAKELFEKLGDENSMKATVSLLHSLAHELNMEWSSKRRMEIIDEALRLGSKAVRAGSASENELAWMYYLLGVFAWQRVYLLEDPTARDQALSECENFNTEAIKLSRDISDHLLIGKANLLAISVAGVRGVPQFVKQHLNAALDSARVTRDNEALADALLANAYDLIWEMASKEIPESRYADFERCKSLAEEALARYRSVLSDRGVADCYALGFAQAYNRLAFAEVDQVKRVRLLEQAAKHGRDALDHFRRSGCAGDETPAHTLMIILYYLASNTTDKEDRRHLLDEASQMVVEDLRQRESTTPFHSWNRGVALYYRAIVQAEVSKIESDPAQKAPVLAAASEGVEKALRHCKEHFGQPAKIRQNIAVGLATYASKLSSILEELYGISGEQTTRDRMISALTEAADFYEQAGWPSRAAETHWRLGQLLDRQRVHTGASEEFETASSFFEAAAERTPEFNAYFKDYASYMRAWSAIERARHQAALQSYDEAAASYSKVSELMRGTKRWEHLADYFAAWATLETAEALSAKEEFQEAAAAFESARTAFARSEAQAEAAHHLPGGEVLLQIPQISAVRKQYCEGRVALERARLHDYGDEASRSAEQYGLAAKIFGRIAQLVQGVADRHEMSSISQLCRGWQLMKEAEGHPSSSLYTEAAEIFAEAAGSGAGEKVESVALADSHFCQAMNLQMEFTKTGDLTVYTNAKTHLQNSMNLYLGVGLVRAADWTEATMAILDAGLYTLEAETATEPEERAKLYVSAEKSLGFALSLSERAGHQSRKALVERELSRVRERVRVALNLAKVMAAPPIALQGMMTGTPAGEEAKGLAAFEGVNIQARVKHESEIEVGETLRIQLDLFNTGKQPASLLKVEEITPKGFKPAVIPDPYLLEGSSLNAKGRLIEPLRIESFVISLSAGETGDFALSPRLVYVDEAGRVTVQALEATNIKVVPQPVFEFKKDEGKAVFECLIQAFIDDYMKRRLSLEESGWRSLVEIAKAANVSRSNLYGKEGRQGPVFYELQSRGIIESRTFTGQRGRGGEVLKARVAYSRDAVKRYVDRRIMRPKQT
jgi:tetratricopeptide (TPR) repeat protein